MAFTLQADCDDLLKKLNMGGGIWETYPIIISNNKKFDQSADLVVSVLFGLTA